jgi:hypothetical protein
MAHMDKVKEHLALAAKAHRQTHEDALRAAAIARAEQDAGTTPSVPQTGLQGPDGGFWEGGDE